MKKEFFLKDVIDFQGEYDFVIFSFKILKSLEDAGYKFLEFAKISEHFVNSDNIICRCDSELAIFDELSEESEEESDPNSRYYCSYEYLTTIKIVGSFKKAVKIIENLK